MAFRFNINLKDIEQLLYWEVANLIKNPRKIKQLAVQRKKGILLTPHQNRQTLIITGAAGKKIKDLLDNYIRKKSLTGSPAYPGYLKGIVRIILSRKDFSKMKKGDILVAPNTRPEYVPIMKIAGAIISEEGGITCHSAIVSRELKIPCIVGVQGACDVLKDGDLIKFNTDKGIVKVIKRKA